MSLTLLTVALAVAGPIDYVINYRTLDVMVTEVHEAQALVRAARVRQLSGQGGPLLGCPYQCVQ